MLRRRFIPTVAHFAFFLALALAAQWAAGVYTSDLNGGDEASHFINGLLVHDYIADGFPGNPVSYAIGYYLHYPKVAIGHWPPLFYPVEAAMFFLVGPSVLSALLLEALIAAGIATLVGWIVARLCDGVAGLLAGIATLAAPEIFGSMQGVMLDNPITLLCLIAMVAWARFLVCATWQSSLGFAAAATAAILTKGNGLYLALVPPLSVVLMARLDLMRNWAFWLPAGIVVVLCAPWYAATYKIAADGFNGVWGPQYVATAAPVFASALVRAIGIPGFLAFAAGSAHVVWHRRRVAHWEIGIAALCIVLADFIYHSIVPVALEPRYLASSVPAMLVLVCFAAEWAGTVSAAVAPALVAALALLVIIGTEFVPESKASRGLEQAAAAILRSPEKNPFILVGSDPAGEGALTVAVATHDRARTIYVVRGFQVLGTGDFMGHGYHAHFDSAQDMGRWIEANGIGWIVIDTGRRSLDWRHNRELLELADSNPRGWTRAARITVDDHEVRVYRVATGFDRPIDIAKLLPQLAPVKVIGRY